MLNNNTNSKLIVNRDRFYNDVRKIKWLESGYHEKIKIGIIVRLVNNRVGRGRYCQTLWGKQKERF